MLQLAKGALDHVAFLVENKITISWLFSVDLGRNHCPNIVVGQPCQERIGIVAFVGKHYRCLAVWTYRPDLNQPGLAGKRPGDGEGANLIQPGRQS